MSKPSSPPKHWAAMQEVSFVTGMRVLFWIFRLCGRWPFRLLLYPVVTWYLLTNRTARMASLTYLARVNSISGAGPNRVRTGMRGALAHFIAFAEVILDKMLLWDGLFAADTVRYVGMEQIDQQIKLGQGGLIICSHLGNPDLSRALAYRRGGAKLTILVHTKHAEQFNRMLARLDPASQLNLMQVTEVTPATAMLLASKIEQGEFVVIAGDRVPVAPQPRVAFASFLGAPAAFPIGPYVLASILQCPVYLLFSLHYQGRPEIHFELLRQQLRLPRKNREQMLQELVADYAARLEYHCLRSPLQWFNFYDFWTLLDTPDAAR